VPSRRRFLGTSLPLALARFAVLVPLVLAGAGCRQAPPARGASEPVLDLVLSGDFPDPTIVRDGSDFYMTNSCWRYQPGLLIWHSRDLERWTPIAAALRKDVGEVWAPDFVLHRGRFYIYFPADGVIWAMSAARPEGPWSDPVCLGVKGIDPGHIATPEGKRYLFIDRGYVMELAPDGMSVLGEPRKVYDGWAYPPDWVVECFCDESPKLLYKDGYYYLTTAQGGTAGPATSHMAVSARSRSLFGPWENSPYNPVVHTWSAGERWWSKGHGTVFEDGRGRWFIVYHAYEKGHLPLGRQVLMEPVEWTADGWFRAARDPRVEPATKIHFNVAVAPDDFSGASLGLQWRLSGTKSAADYELSGGRLRLSGEPDRWRALHATVGDHGYEAVARIDVEGGAEAGLFAYYDERMFAGVGIAAEGAFLYSKGRRASAPFAAAPARFLKIRLEAYALSVACSEDGESWIPCPTALEVSGYQHNMLGGFMSLKVGVAVRGEGAVFVDDFRYEPLD
jgi:beta-xylosidase